MHPRESLDTDHPSLTAYTSMATWTTRKRLPRQLGPDWLELTGAYKNNLKGVDIRILHVDCHHWRADRAKAPWSIGSSSLAPGRAEGLGGGQSALGALSGSVHKSGALSRRPKSHWRSSRSNPVTYVEAYDEIRQLFGGTGIAKARGYKPSH